jgi:hypothetical protein
MRNRSSMTDADMDGTLPRLAMALCVRDEAEFLPANLLYHHAVGVSRAYVFLNRCKDDSARIASSLPWVRPILLDPEEVGRFVYVADLHAACMNRALELARAEGFDWLLFLDPDEFAAAGSSGPQDASATERAHLGRMLAGVAPETEVVLLATREVVPVRLPARTRFWRQHFFQVEPRLSWRILDPLTGVVADWKGFLGHRLGKSIVRTSAVVQAFDSHWWVPDQGVPSGVRPEYVPLRTERTGIHLHFYVSGQEQWHQKFWKDATGPDVYLCGTPVEFPKRCWRHAIKRLPAAQLAGYFDRWVARPEEELLQLCRDGVVIESDLPEAVLREAGVLRGGDVRLPQFHLRRTELFRPWSDPRSQFEKQSPVVRLRYPLSQARELLQGFYGLEWYGADLFRWAGPSASLRLRLPPGDYRLCIHMKGLVSMWAGRFDVSLNGRPVPCRDRRLENGVLSQVLLRSDFPSAAEFVLGLEFPPLDTSSWPTSDSRQLGAALTEISFEPIAGSAAA